MLLGILLRAAAICLGIANAADLFEPNGKMTAVDSQKFGLSLAVDGDVAVVGSHNPSGPGKAYLFNPTTNQKIAELQAPDTPAGVEDRFGRSVSIKGNNVLVGSSEQTVSSIVMQGAAYVFGRSGNFVTTLVASNGFAEQKFGYAVALGDDLAAVGTLGSHFYTGEVYIFNVSTWTQTQILLGQDSQKNDLFGCAIAVHEHTVLVGARGEGNDNRGAAYVFDGVTGVQIHKIRPADTGSQERFGQSVAILPDGKTAAISFPYENQGGANGEIKVGTVYLYDMESGTVIYKYAAPDGDADNNDMFGWSVSASGNFLLIGAFGDVGVGLSSTDQKGAAYIFRTDGDRSFVQKLTAHDPDASTTDQYGRAVAIDGTYALVAAIGYQGNKGTVYGYGLLDCEENWTPWSACTASCNFGTRHRAQKMIDPLAQYPCSHAQHRFQHEPCAAEQCKSYTMEQWTQCEALNGLFTKNACYYVINKGMAMSWDESFGECQASGGGVPARLYDVNQLHMHIFGFLLNRYPEKKMWWPMKYSQTDSNHIDMQWMKSPSTPALPARHMEDNLNFPIGQEKCLVFHSTNQTDDPMPAKVDWQNCDSADPGNGVEKALCMSTDKIYADYTATPSTRVVITDSSLVFTASAEVSLWFCGLRCLQLDTCIGFNFQKSTSTCEPLTVKAGMLPEGELKWAGQPIQVYQKITDDSTWSHYEREY